MTLVASFDRSISFSCTSVNDEWTGPDWGFVDCGETRNVVSDGHFQADATGGRDERMNKCDLHAEGVRRASDADSVVCDPDTLTESSVPEARELRETADRTVIVPTPAAATCKGEKHSEQQAAASGRSFEDENHTVGKPLDVRPKVFHKKPHRENRTVDVAQTEKEKISKRRRSKKERKARRENKQSKWRSVDPAAVGFHVSLLPLCLPFEPEDFLEDVEEGEGGMQVSGSLDEKRSDGDEMEDPGCLLGATCLELCQSHQETSEPFTEELDCCDKGSDVRFFGALGIDVRDASDGDEMDDVSFFGSLGIDITDPGNCDDEEDDHIDWDGVSLFDDCYPDYLKVKDDLTISAECSESSVSQILPRLANFERRLFFELECATSKKVYMRKDKERRTEKAHRAVKSKNCRTLSNNKGRKTLYMHHRLIKMNGFISYTEFRLSMRVSRSPMPKRGVDLEVARRIEVKGQSVRPAPVQNLAHALHSSNAPCQLATDLASFLISLQHRELTPEDYDMLLRLDDSVAPKTVSKSALASLRTETVGAEGGGDALCSVCMEPYVAGQMQKFLRCGHVFHSECIDTWLQNSSTNCPLDGLPVEAS